MKSRTFGFLGTTLAIICFSAPVQLSASGMEGCPKDCIRSRATKGQVCVYCTSHRLGLTDAQRDSVAKAFKAYNASVAKAQEKLLKELGKKLPKELVDKFAAQILKPQGKEKAMPK